MEQQAAEALQVRGGTAWREAGGSEGRKRGFGPGGRRRSLRARWQLQLSGIPGAMTAAAQGSSVPGMFVASMAKARGMATDVA